jgi:hypothetical protein
LGNKLHWFKSHYRHISLCSTGSWTCASSILRNTQHSQKTDIHAPSGIRTHNLCRRGAVDPLSAQFFMYPYYWKHLLKGTVQRVSMMGVLGTRGGFALALFQGWGRGVKYCWEMCSSNFSFRNKFIIFLSCGLLEDTNTF